MNKPIVALTVFIVMTSIAATLALHIYPGMGSATPTGNWIAGNNSTNNAAPARNPDVIVSFSFDDDFKSHVLAMEMMKEYGYRGTAAVITGFLGAPGNYLALSDVRLLQSGKWEIASHTVNHNDLEKLNPAQLEYQLSASKQFLEKNKINATTLVYPFNGVNENVVAQAKKHYSRGRSTCFNETIDRPVIYTRTPAWNETEKHCLNYCPGTSAFYIKSLGVNERIYSPAWLKSLMSNANGTNKKIWLDLHFHALAGNVTDPGMQLSTGNFRNILDAMKSYNVSVVPIDEAYARCIS